MSTKISGPLFAALLACTASGHSAAPPTMRVCIYYDGGQPASELYAIQLKNLLGHFREVSSPLIDVRGYKSAGLNGCQRAAFIGSHYETDIPNDFLRDTAGYLRPFLWMNYGIWKLEGYMSPEAFSRKTGFRFSRLRGVDEGPAGRIPGFFRYFDYKGRRFKKLAALDKNGRLLAAPEIAVVKNISARAAAQAVHSVSGETVPYILEKNGFFYVGDNPFVHAHSQDRYLIFADILFDFLRLPPRGTRYALLRLEDVHPKYNLSLLYKTLKILKKRGIPFAISVIPKYVEKGKKESKGFELTQRTSFVKALEYAQENRAEILLHGYTHHVPSTEECPSLGSGADYEFWDRCRDAPLPYDSKEFARERVVRAKTLLASAGIAAIGWVTPHYEASAADFAVFARYFDRVVQRVDYSVPGPDINKPLAMDQFFPYTIYKDHYGQFIWPENLGFVPMPGSDWGYATPADIVETVHLMSVIRDSWASFFWHPYLMAHKGESKKLEQILEAIQSHGYKFVSLKSLKNRGE